MLLLPNIYISKYTCPSDKKSRCCICCGNDSGIVFTVLIAFCLIVGVCNFAQTVFTIWPNIKRVRKRCVTERQLLNLQVQDSLSHLRWC